MKNLNRWRLYCSEYATADQFVDAGWVALVGAALQRRVWVDSGKPIYPNHYMLFVAPPGVGKSLVTDEVVKVLRTYKLRSIETAPEDDASSLGVTSNAEPKLRIPIAADSTSYEAFVRETCSNPRTIKTPKGIYTHMSMTFVLDEATSIFHKEAEKMVSFLLSGWNCKETHRHSGIVRGNDTCKNLCINLLGGTQPDKFSKINAVDLISSGFTRRTIIIYAPHNRFERALIPPQSPVQLAAYADIIKHINEVTRLYGPVRLSAEAMEWYVSWWETPGRYRVNDSPKLADYYTSQNMHLLKVATALHFGETVDSMVIELDTLLEAKKMLEGWELTAHHAYSGGKDEFASVKREVIKRLSLAGNEASLVRLYSPYVDDMSINEFKDLMTDLIAAGRVKPVNGSSYKINTGEVFK